MDVRAVMGAAALLLLLAAPGWAAGEDIFVVVHANGPLPGVTAEEIREIELGNVRYVKGEPVTPAHLREGPVRDAFLTALVGMTTKEYRRYWTRKVFQDGVPLPPTRESPELMLAFVRSNRGAIGYVPRSAFGDGKGMSIVAVVPGR